MDFPFNEDDTQRIALEEMAKLMVPMFQAMVKEGLSGQEAAALTAAYWHQLIPRPSPDPMED